MGKEPPLPLEEAQGRLLGLAPELPIEHVDIDGAVGRYLAMPLHARRTQPASDLSAMDGYAVHSADMQGPWHVVGESRAGHPWTTPVQAGEAVRISTGAVMPAGADSVILQEDLHRSDHRIELTGEAPVPPTKHVRPRGMDFNEGEVVLAAGLQLGSAQAALALAAGHKHVPVRRAPRVAIIDSGDELAPDCENCAPHQIPASNGTMLAAMIGTLPAEVQRLGPVPDDLDSLLAALDSAEHADVIVTSGGASVGDHDLIRPALARWGANLDFWRVAIKPGKPILVATRQNGRGMQTIIGLPGNPVSSHVTAYLFLLPYLRAMMGSAAPLPRVIRTRLGAPLRASGMRREFLRASWDGQRVKALALQDSGALSSLASSNALIDRSPGAPGMEAGEEVSILLLANGGIA